jgi:predicted CXXCH cytochrome family protein
VPAVIDNPLFKDGSILIMKRTMVVCGVILTLAAGTCGTAWSSTGGYAPPHSDYRTGYLGGCGSGTACHSITKGTFLPDTLNNPPAPPYPNYTNFCLSCHNAAGEAHEKAAGSPSTNVYVNFTGIDKGASYTGDSHNWNGLSGNAGTRTPAASGYAGTNFMPGGAVRCQTCHIGAAKSGEQNIAGAAGEWLQAVDQGDQKSYKISGSESTRQYLAKYLKVYRSPVALSAPASRARKAYQIYTGFTYNYQNATITFGRAQGAPSSVYIYATIGQPYLRAGNAANAACVDCHNNRNSQAVPHVTGSGVKNLHPTGVVYGHAFGAHTTLKPSPSGNVYLEYTATLGSRVLCTTCHDPHNAASKNGQLLREADDSTLCADCHKTRMDGYSTAGAVNVHNGPRHISPTGCTECHSAHGKDNLYLVKSRVKTPSGTSRAVDFQNMEGARSFGDDSGNSICEVCHTQTEYHKADGTGAGHNTGTKCTACHNHEKGFLGSPGGSPCYGCHRPFKGAVDIQSLMGLGTSFRNGGKASRHIISYDNTNGSSCLEMCHKGKHNANSPNLATATELALCNGCHSLASDELTSQGRSIRVGQRYAGSMHDYTTAAPDEFGLFSYRGSNCTKCHLPHGSDNYPSTRASINGKATNGNTEDLCFGCHDSQRNNGAVDIKTLWKANPANPGHIDTEGRPMKCVACHGPHGTANEKMIHDSLGGPGLARDAICRACHGGGGLSAYNVMTSAAGGYGPNFSAVSVHSFGSQVNIQVAIGGRTVDLTCYGCHDPHNTKNARHLREKIVFSNVSMAGLPSEVNVPPISAVVQPHGPTISYVSGWTTYCAICHTSLTATGGQSPYRRHPTGIGPGPFFPHTSGFGVKPLPMESGTISCISCHYTHGSPKQSLLRFEDARTPENIQCLQCHDQDKFMQGGAGSHGGFLQNEGRCSDCHNMHSKANKRLLVEATESVLCERCHAGGPSSKYNVWRQLTSMDPYALKGTGGTFGLYSELRGGTARSLHAVNDEATLAPGGVTTQHRCGTCHNPHGSKNYRILRTVINNVTGIAVYARTDASGAFVNYSTGLVKFCTACHTNYGVTDDGNRNWIRHPVGVPLNNYTSERDFYANNTSYSPKVELEAGNTISCVSCHFAHGSGADANLKYPGGKTVNACKTCHNRTFDAGTPGSHAGYTDNNGTCSDCHSMHADGNPKLLKDSAETEVCVSCHDYPGTSTSPNRSHLDVWKGNVFNSPTSWFGSAGSFGTYNPVRGGNAFSMHPVNSDALIAPGDSATVVHCGTCHDSHGSSNYRLLKTRLNGKNGIAVSATVDSHGRTTSYGSGMSGFCTACHKAYIQCGSSAGYTRHPVDVALTAQEMANYNHAQGGRYLPLEAGNKVTCITCHFAHGSPNADMLRLPGNQMCQACHAKGLDTLNGYVDVKYTHGGFNGNGGNCSVCHSMHVANNRKLLLNAEESDLCYGCHASGSAYPSVWKGDQPQTPGGWDGTGGSFGAFYNRTTGGTAKSHHSINKTDSPAPGGTTVEHHCGTCHNPHGNNNYRLLRDDVNGRSGISVKVGVLGNYSTGMNAFCSACHVMYAQTGSGVEGYQRHPLGLMLTSKEQANLTSWAGAPKAQVENKKVMCLSCHFAHGSASYAMLRMPSITSSQSALCQQCHRKGYNAAGVQFTYTHGGFNGNNANCIVCHSTHAKNNKKLLVEPKETTLCNDCHAGIGKFNDFKSHNPDVKIDKPSRFNVFSSIGNSFGNYSVGGGDVLSWHEVDGTHSAPGGKTLELRCGKCHSPHGEDNFVMLRNTIENVTGIRVFGYVSSTGPYNKYYSGFGKFCSACHTRLTSCFNVYNHVTTITRHPVDFRLQKAQLHNWSSTTLTPKVPVENGSQVTCITCHNSHGSKNYSLQRIGGNNMCQQCHKR